MKCRICHQDRAGDTIITIVNDPPIEVCPECSPLFEKWIIIQNGLAIVDLVEDRFNFDTLEIDYKPVVTEIISSSEDMGYRTSLKCAICGQIYPNPKTISKHIKTHKEPAYAKN